MTLNEATDFFSKPRNQNYIVEEFVSHSREYRIHVSSRGVCFYTCRKMLKNDTPEGDRWFRNSKNCVWILEENEDFNKPATWDKIVADCLKALNALGLDTCAFDVKVNKSGDWTILEGNSAPSFGNTSIQEPTIVMQRYEEEFLHLIEHKKKK